MYGAWTLQAFTTTHNSVWKTGRGHQYSEIFNNNTRMNQNCSDEIKSFSQSTQIRFFYLDTWGVKLLNSPDQELGKVAIGCCFNAWIKYKSFIAVNQILEMGIVNYIFILVWFLYPKWIEWGKGGEGRRHSGESLMEGTVTVTPLHSVCSVCHCAPLSQGSCIYFFIVDTKTFKKIELLEINHKGVCGLE